MIVFIDADLPEAFARIIRGLHHGPDSDIIQSIKERYPTPHHGQRGPSDAHWLLQLACLPGGPKAILTAERRLLLRPNERSTLRVSGAHVFKLVEVHWKSLRMPDRYAAITRLWPLIDEAIHETPAPTLFHVTPGCVRLRPKELI